VQHDVKHTIHIKNTKKY